MTFLTSSGRRAAVASFALVATALVAPTVTSGEPAVAATDGASAAELPTLKIRPTGTVFFGEILDMSGTVPGPGGRTIVVEYREGKRGVEIHRWHRYRPTSTNPDGTWTEGRSVPSDSSGTWFTWRLVALADPEAGLTRSVSPLRYRYAVRQTADLLVDPDVATEGGSTTLTATSTPVRPGRPVQFQERTDTGWVALGDPTAQSEDGTAELVLDDLEEGSRVLRVKVGRGIYDSPTVSPKRTLRVEPAPGR